MGFVVVASRGSLACNAANTNVLVRHAGYIKRSSNPCFVSHSISDTSRQGAAVRPLPSLSRRPLSIGSAPATFYRSPTQLCMSTQTNPKQSSSQSTNKSKIKSSSKPIKKKSPGTGLLRQLPPLSPHAEILSRSTRQTYNTIKDDPKVSNVKRRTQKRGAQTLDFLQQSLCRPLRETVDTYKRLYRNMHPFERVVMDLTVTSLQKRDGTTLSSLLEEVNDARKEVMELSKDWISKIKSAESAREAYEFTEEGKESVGRVFDDLLGDCWGGMVEIQRALRKVPMVRLDCPAVVLVGAPNVGEFV